MGIGNLFKGYIFFKCLIGGITFLVGSIVLLGWMIVARGDLSALFPILFLLFGGAMMLLISLSIWRREGGKHHSSTSTDARIGYSKGTNREVCPECGEKKMDVSFDGSGVCDNCGYATRDYHSEK